MKRIYEVIGGELRQRRDYETKQRRVLWINSETAKVEFYAKDNSKKGMDEPSKPKFDDKEIILIQKLLEEINNLGKSK